MEGEIKVGKERSLLDAVSELEGVVHGLVCQLGLPEEDEVMDAHPNSLLRARDRLDRARSRLVGIAEFLDKKQAELANSFGEALL